MVLNLFLVSAAILLSSLVVPRLPSSSLRRFSTSRSMAEYKNIIVVGGSYVGITTADELVKALPAASPSGTPYRVLVVEKHSHFEHLFAFPRCEASLSS